LAADHILEDRLMHRLFVLGALTGLCTLVVSVARPALGGTDPGTVAQNVKCETLTAPGSQGDTTWADGDVDKLAEPKRNNPRPKFPSAFKDAPSAEYETYQKEKVSGEVYLRYVVDTMGCVDMSSVTVLATTDSSFTEEVLKVLPQHRFEPARKGGKKVRAWLGWRYLFYREQGPRLPF
jgi:hypothetical protein